MRISFYYEPEDLDVVAEAEVVKVRPKWSSLRISIGRFGCPPDWILELKSESPETTARYINERLARLGYVSLDIENGQIVDGYY